MNKLTTFLLLFIITGISSKATIEFYDGTELTKNNVDIVKNGKSQNKIQVKAGWFPDSIITYDKYGAITKKILYTYDEQGNLSIEENINNGIPSLKYTYEYEGDTQTRYCYKYNTSNNKYEYFCRNIYTLDNNGNILTDEYQNYSGTDWVKYSYREITYDADGNTTLIINYREFKDSSWTPKSKSEYIYNYNQDGINLSIELLSSEYSSGEWNIISGHKTIYEYDKQERIIKQYDCLYNSNTGGWIPKELSSYYLYEYPTTNTRIRYSADDNYDGRGVVMNNQHRIIDTFDSKNRCILHENSSNKNGKWITTSQYKYVYDALDRQKEYLVYLSSDGKQFNLNSKEVTYYDDGTVGIAHTPNSMPKSTQDIYNLRGQRLIAPQRGINIIGGKKVLY